MDPSVNSFTNAFERAILQHLHEEGEKIREKLIEEAVEQFRVKLRQAIGTVAIDMSNYFSVERAGCDIVIHAKIESKEKNRG